MTLGGRRAQLEGFAFVAPFLILNVFLLIYPLFRGIMLSMYLADPFDDGRFVGLENYARLAADPVFHLSMWNTFIVTLMIVPVLTVIALALALALNRATRGAAIFRGIFFASSVLSVTIVTLIWRFVLAPDAGLLGELWTAFGWEPLPFLSHPDLALPAIAITTIWWSLGLPMMLFLAGLQQIPEDVYEAAALDRASKWTTFWRVTLPSLRHTLDHEARGLDQQLNAGLPGVCGVVVEPALVAVEYEDVLLAAHQPGFEDFEGKAGIGRGLDSIGPRLPGQNVGD
jgi:multiple sugar transport system permease protein